MFLFKWCASSFSAGPSWGKGVLSAVLLHFSEAGRKNRVWIHVPFLEKDKPDFCFWGLFSLSVWTEPGIFKSLISFTRAWKKSYFEVFIIKEFGKSICDNEVFIAQVRAQSK